MKHSTRSMLRTAVILFAAGLLLTTSCYIYAAANDIDIYGISSGKAQYVSYKETIGEILLRSPNATKNISPNPDHPDFSSLEIYSQVGDIELRTTDGDTYIEYENVDVNNLKCEILGDTLSISEIDPVSFMGVSIKNEGIAFDGLRQIFNSKSSLNKDRKVIVYLGSGVTLESLSANANVGKVILDSVSAREATINVAYGEANVSNCDFTGGTIKINGDMSDITFDKNIYSMCNIAIIKGDIFAIVSNGKSNMETTLGNVSVTATKKLSDYTIRMSTNYGKVKVEGEEMKDTEYNQSGSSDYIWAKAGFGSLTVSSEYVAGDNGVSNPPDTYDPNVPEIPEIY
ncbi:MAG: DUF4097 domain-containing protein [Ruminococcaceae bacterium]|nr:DUF4097 domain-containing protein [Oscillospiraceae bacterium]